MSFELKLLWLAGFKDGAVGGVEGGGCQALARVLEVKNYGFTYAGSSRPALTDINLSVEQGEIVVIAGPSGCGKSTLLKSIMGLIPHTYSGERSGFIFVEGVEVAETSVGELAKKVGFVFQNPENQIFMFSVERDIAFGLENMRLSRDEIRERVDWALSLLGIKHLAKSAPYELSDGQKQRVALAGVLAMRPRILILDEPTSLLDPHTAYELVSLVKRLRDTLGVTVMIVEHRLDLLAGIATRITVISEGRLVLDGPPRSVLSSKEAEIVGIGVPLATRLHLLLRDVSIDLGEPSLTMGELAERLNVIFRD